MIVDYQRTRVYAWETANNLYHGSGGITQEEVTPLIVRIWNTFNGVGPAPTFVYIPSANRGHAHGDREIDLGGTCLWLGYVLHEMAHCLTYNRTRQQKLRDQDLRHGPEFIEMLITLHVHYTGADPFALVSSAKDFKIIVAGLDSLVDSLILAKNTTSDPVERKKIRRQLRRANQRAIDEAAGRPS